MFQVRNFISSRIIERNNYDSEVMQHVKSIYEAHWREVTITSLYTSNKLIYKKVSIFGKRKRPKYQNI